MRYCRRKILLSVASIALGTSLMSYKAYAQANVPLQTTERLQVFDSNGKRVGNVLGFAGDPSSSVIPVIAFYVDKILVPLGVIREMFVPVGRLVGSDSRTLVSESTTCSGSLFAVTSDLPTLADRNFLYVQRVYTATGPAGTVIAKSSPESDGICSTFPPIQLTAVPVRLLVDLSTQFKPPYELAESAGKR